MVTFIGGYALFYALFVHSAHTRRKATGLPVLARAMDAQAGKALADRHHFQRVDIDMRGQGGDPPYRFGHIFRC